MSTLGLDGVSADRPRCATTSDTSESWEVETEHTSRRSYAASALPGTTQYHFRPASACRFNLTPLLHAAINPATAVQLDCSCRRATFSWRWLYMLHGAAEADWTATVIDRKEAVPLPAEARLVLRPDASSEGLSSWKLRPFVRGGACPSQWLPVLLATSACRLRREPLCPSR